MGVTLLGAQTAKCEPFSASRKNSECRNLACKKKRRVPIPNLNDNLLSKLLFLPTVKWESWTCSGRMGGHAEKLV